MSARKDRDEPLVMFELREYLLAPRMGMMLSRHMHPIVRNGQVGPGVRTWWHTDGRVELIH